MPGAPTVGLNPLTVGAEELPTVKELLLVTVTDETVTLIVPTAVKLVELLQFLKERPFKARPLRVALVVSAWDLLADSQLTPVSWVDRHLPLLAQFLRSNEDGDPFRVYGISAQGGELSQAAELLKKRKPSERVQVVCEGYDGHDITTPIFWLLQ